MNLNDAKDTIFDMVYMFFPKTAILWEEQNATKPAPPYISLRARNFSRNLHQILDDEGKKIYNCETILEINLYTKGKKVSSGKNTTASYINTATSDMMDFCNFLESEFGTNYLSSRDMAVLLSPPIRDLSALENDSKYRYRAMAEFQVSFVEVADGLYGVSNMKKVPNSSGGASDSMVSEPIETIEDVEIIYEEE